jgi:hypothetical protein
MHWSKLENYIRTHTNNNFVLIHFSSRYTDEEITNFFADKMTDNLIVWT